MNNLKLRVIEDNDIPMLKLWLNKDYIIKWYVDPDEWLNEVNERFGEFSFINHFIVTQNDKPFGFCQYYPCSEAGEDWYGDTPLEGTYSIDYLIGEEEYLRKGFGKAIIELLIQEIFSLQGAERIIVQPEQENPASCNTLLSSGFIFDEKNEFYIIKKN